MNPFLIALTAFSTLDSMQSASRQAALIEQQAKADAANARLRGLETHNARLRNLDVALSTNNAIAGFTGRSDRSIDAINRRLREDASTDVARNAQNTIANIAASNLEANVARMRGQTSDSRM
jgi:hypothetical protein